MQSYPRCIVHIGCNGNVKCSHLARLVTRKAIELGIEKSELIDCIPASNKAKRVEYFRTLNWQALKEPNSIGWLAIASKLRITTIEVDDAASADKLVDSAKSYATKQKNFKAYAWIRTNPEKPSSGLSAVFLGPKANKRISLDGIETKDYLKHIEQEVSKPEAKRFIKVWGEPNAIELFVSPDTCLVYDLAFQLKDVKYCAQ